MLFDDITLIEGADISNLSVAIGTLVDRGNLTPNEGEIFYQTDNDPGFYAYITGAWSKIGTADDVTNHANDLSLHVTASQNTLLDGLTVTFDKLNYTTDVTSNLQAQLDLKSADADVLKKDGSVEVEGALLPEMTGASGNVSVRDLGSTTQRFNAVYADEVFVGASSLYVNGKKVIEDVADTMTFATDANQAMVVSTNGIGGLALTTENAILNLSSTSNEVNIDGAGGIEANVGAALATKHINFTNASTGGNITFTATGTSSNVQFNAVAGVTLTAPTITLAGTITTDGYADLDDTISTISGSLGSHNHDADYVKLNGSTMTAALTLSGNPTLGNHAANKTYVDSAITGLDTKDSVRVASEVNLTLTGTLTVDSVITTAGDRVLVKAQTDAKTNGIYVVAGGAWARSDDADNTPSNEVSGGMYVFVEEGTINGDTGWTLSSITGDAVLGTDDLTFSKFSNVTAPVSSVNGNTGAVTLVKADVGLGNADNTSDLNKVISTLTQAEIDTKLDTASYTAADVLAKLITVDGPSSGLDADTVDGKAPAASPTTFTGNTLVERDSSGDIYTGHLNMTADDTANVPTQMAIEISNDGFLRWQTPAQFITNMNILTTASVVDGGTF